MSIVIVDYNVGNIGSVEKALSYLGVEAVLSSDPEVLQSADTLILPGQGAADSAMTRLRELGLVELIKSHIHSGKRYLGICLGFQLLFEHTEEDGGQECLGIFPGTVKRFDHELSVPHMGWNQLDVVSDPNGVFVSDTPLFAYFANSFYVPMSSMDCVSTTTEYGYPFVSSVQTPSLLATQFHPEKSGDVGLGILRRFLVP